MSVAKKRVKAIGRVVLLVIISLLIGLRLYSWNAKTLVGNLMPMPFGWGVSVVLSGSMEPALSVDDLVIVHEQKSYGVGDVVVFQDGASLVIHRIIAMEGDEVITQGDDNTMADEPISLAKIKGKMVASIPYAGIVVRFLKSPVGFVLVLVAALALFELPYLRQRRKETEEQEKIKEEIRKLKEQ